MKNFKYFAWSCDSAYLSEIMEEMSKRGIECDCDNYLGRYLLSASKDSYQESLKIVREIGDENRIGSLNQYDEFRPLKAHSLVYACIKDAKVLDKGWEYEFSRPKNIKKMIEKLKDICGCNVQLSVNCAEAAVEIIIDKELENMDRIRESVSDFLYDNNYVKFRKIYACTSEGKVINPEDPVKRPSIYRLFDASFLACGMYRPEGNNLVPKDNEDSLDESGYHPSREKYGIQDDINNIEEDSKEKVVITGNAELYEIKYYNHTWDATRCVQNRVLPFETTLIDKLGYNMTIILSDNMVAKITTKYEDSRKVSSTRKLPFGVKFPSEKSARNGLLPYPKKNGQYNGIIEEYFMRSTDGTKLLHYVTHTPYFELYDIPEDFDFVNNNEALEKFPRVYDIREYNPEDPKIAPIKDLIDKTVKKLELTTTKTTSN